MYNKGFWNIDNNGWNRKSLINLKYLFLLQIIKKWFDWNDFGIDIIILKLCLQAKFGSSYVTC